MTRLSETPRAVSSLSTRAEARRGRNKSVAAISLLLVTHRLSCPLELSSLDSPIQSTTLHQVLSHSFTHVISVKHNSAHSPSSWTRPHPALPDAQSLHLSLLTPWPPSFIPASSLVQSAHRGHVSARSRRQRSSGAAGVEGLDQRQVAHQLVSGQSHNPCPSPSALTGLQLDDRVFHHLPPVHPLIRCLSSLVPQDPPRSGRRWEVQPPRSR